MSVTKPRINETWSASPSSDNTELKDVIAREQNRAVQTVLMAHRFLRHELISHEAETKHFQHLIFGSLVGKSPARGWSAHVATCIEQLYPSSAALLSSSVARHYLQRWVRQLLDPEGELRIARDGSNGIGLIYNGVATVTQQQQWVLNDYLDGTVVQPSPPLPSTATARIMSVYQERGQENAGIVVGPVSYLNHHSRSPYVLQSLGSLRLHTAILHESTKSSMDDRVFYPGTAFPYVFVQHREVGDAVDDPGPQPLVPGVEICIRYNESV